MTPQGDPQNELKELFNSYISECEYSGRLRPETIRGYKNVFNLFLKIMPEVTNLESLTTGMLNTFFKRIETRKRIVGKDKLKTGVKKSTIKTQWRKLNVFFVWLSRKGLKENPLNGIKPPHVSYDDYRRLDDDQVSKIYSTIVSRSVNPLLLRRDTLMVSLLLFLGIRKGEFISLQVRDIDIQKSQITIRGETSKSKKTRVMKMHPTLVLHFKDYLRERNMHGLKTEHLIVSNIGDRGLSREGLKHWVENMKRKSGVKFFLHQFRHTFACKLAENDVGVFKIQKLLGHSSVNMTMKYTRSLETEDMGEDIDKISF